MSLPIDVQVYNFGEAATDDRARVSSIALIEQWTAHRHKRRHIDVIEPPRTARATGDDRTYFTAPAFLAKGSAIAKEWLEGREAPKELPTDWHLDDLKDFEPAARKRKSSTAVPTDDEIVGKVLEPPKTKRKVEEPAGRPSEAGRGVVWSIIKPPWRTVTQVEPFIEASRRLPSHPIKHSFLATAELNALIATQTRVCWIIPLWQPSHLPLFDARLSRPIWSRERPPPEANLLYWRPSLLEGLWEVFNDLATATRLGHLRGHIIETTNGAEEIRLWCGADRATNVRATVARLEGANPLNQVTLLLCDAGGRAILLA